MNELITINEIEFRLNIGQKLKQIRESRELSQDDLAKLINITRTTISKIENGKFSFGIDLLGKYCKVFDLNIHFENNIIKNSRP